jgi:hypothetical protein
LSREFGKVNLPEVFLFMCRKSLILKFFKMLLTAKNVNSDLPPIGFSIDWLLGSKYAPTPNILEKLGTHNAHFLQ